MVGETGETSDTRDFGHGRLRTRETSDTGDFGHYTQPRAEALNHESITIYMYTNTYYDAYKRLRMLGELA